MTILYSKITPYKSHTLKVTAPHVIYVEECGNPEGIPIVVVHGGPGGGCSEQDRQFFDPQIYRIILFDQRGCGRSTPNVRLENNTTQDLIDDLETIRTSLKISKWILFGGSWGTTLGLLYAQEHPNRVHGLILRGVFLGRSEDKEWLYQKGAPKIFPDYYADLLSIIPENERDDIVKAYHKKIFSKDLNERKLAVTEWAKWEVKCATLLPMKEFSLFYEDFALAKTFSMICNHYFFHDLFITENQILDNINKITHLPTIIVHGRYDILCPVENAHTLNQHLPSSELWIAADSGHASAEKGIMGSLVSATKKMAEIIS